MKPDGTPPSDADKAERRRQILQIFDATHPDVLITEAYPLGRWAMDFELHPLLLRAQERGDRPLILASVRDILQMPKTKAKSERSIALFEEFYDGMLVHGDPAIARIEESFPPVAAFLDKAHYTGLVAPDEKEDQPHPIRSSPRAVDVSVDVIVSAGGGAIGEAVITAAIAAKPMCGLANATWLALAGPRMADDVYERLEAAAAANGIRLERYHANLTALMATASLSIQRAGYNTVADALVARCRCVLIPDADNQQHEQTVRAEQLAGRGAATVLAERELSGRNLAAAIDKAMLTEQASITVDTRGGRRSAELVIELFAAHSATRDAEQMALPVSDHPSNPD